MSAQKNLEQLADDYVRYKRSNGYIYNGGEYHLKKYVYFSKRESPEEAIPSRKTVSTFMDVHAGTAEYLYNLVAVLREFSRYLITMGYENAYVIPAKKVSLPTPVQPYLFTQAEINAFFIVCDSVQNDPHFKGRHLVLPAMYRLLYCCGLRCKEFRILMCTNVCLKRNYIDVIQSKGPKSRRMFISEELSEHLKVYDRNIQILFPLRTTFFPNRYDKPYGAQMVEKNFLRFWYMAFPEKEGSGISIRPYDFRHHFAYANMNHWLREGKDVNAMLPYLMKYMGHSDIENTLYYFHLVPDIYGTIVRKSLPFEEFIPEVDQNDEKE
jgi:integrase